MFFCLPVLPSCFIIGKLDRRIGQRRDATRAPTQARNGWRPSGRLLVTPPHHLSDGQNLSNLWGPPQCYDFGDQRYDRLARISVAQIYRLRKSAGYRKQRVVYQCTRAVQVAIGQRRAPQPEGRPGYLRVDTVHQGDRDGVKGVYHINAVDEVTQWEVVSATAQ